MDKGLRPGPLLGQLKSGEDVTLPDGTIVYAKDVKTPDEPGSVFIGKLLISIFGHICIVKIFKLKFLTLILLVLDVPDMEYLDSLLESKEFLLHQEKTASSQIDLPDVIIHFTPNSVLCSEKFVYII